MSMIANFHMFIATICSINMLSIFIYSISSFGNGMLFHIGWQFCARLSNMEVCSGTIATASILITIAAFVLLPIQMAMLFDHIDWKLGMHLSVCQQVGVFIGMYVSFTMHSDWLARGLGISMLIIAIQKAIAEINTIDTGVNPESVYRYDFKGIRNYMAVWGVGLSSGFFGGLYAAGGPPLMWFVATTNLEKDVCRGTVSFLYLVENIGRIVFLIISMPQDEILNLGWPYFLAVLAGLTATSMTGLMTGSSMVGRINQQNFRYIVLFMLGFGSLLLSSTGCSDFETLVIISVSAVLYALIYFYYLWRIKGRGTVNVISPIFELVSHSTDSSRVYSYKQYVVVNTSDVDHTVASNIDNTDTA